MEKTHKLIVFREELIPKKIMKYNPVREGQEKLPISHADSNIKVSRKEAGTIKYFLICNTYVSFFNG